jgi:succinate dehydrogenase flavin-adding protein (antitoxin of CptAB toxin-antitoxin module)
MSTEDKVDQKAKEDLFKLLDSIDWKLWEIYNMMKDNLPEHEEETVVKGKKYVRKRDE